MTLLQQMIEETQKQADEKAQQAQQLNQQLQQGQQAFQQLVKEHNDLIVRLNTLNEIAAAGDGLTAEVVGYSDERENDKVAQVEELTK